MRIIGIIITMVLGGLFLLAFFLPDDLSPVTDGPIGTECTSDVDCVPAGCSGELCVVTRRASSIVTSCEYREEYQCLRLTACGCQAGRCAWAGTKAYLACLADLPPLQPVAD